MISRVGQHTTVPWIFYRLLRGLLIWLYNTQKADEDLGEGNKWACPGGKNTLILLRRNESKEQDSIREARKKPKENRLQRRKRPSPANAGFRVPLVRCSMSIPFNTSAFSQSSILILIRSVMVTLKGWTWRTIGSYKQTWQDCWIYFPKTGGWWVIIQMIACPTGLNQCNSRHSNLMCSIPPSLLAFDHLPFAFRQHDVDKWEEGQDKKFGFVQ